MQYSYRAFGLSIQSDFLLPYLLPGGGEPDLVVRFIANAPEYPFPSAGNSFYRISPARVDLGFRDAATFEIREGREVLVWPYLGADPEILHFYIIGSVMAFVLWQRGLFPLHASSIVIRNRVVAFVGESGAGKSSAAAILQARGHSLVADDLTAVTLAGGHAEVKAIPAFPRIRLWTAVAKQLGYPKDSIPPLVACEDKLAVPVDHFAREPLPLRAIYVLSREAAADIEPLGPRDKILELLRHSYPNRLPHGSGEEGLVLCSELASRIPIFRMRSFDHVSYLPDLCRQVEESSGD